MNEATIKKLARMVHISNGIWHKIGVSSEQLCTTCWEELDEYHQELYIANIESMLEYYRCNLSPIRFFWRLYYEWVIYR